jgi:metallo-beta-lactamase class B
MLDFFKNDLLAKGWFRKAALTRDRGAMLPFRMIGTVYYVGDGHVSSHLITSEAGHILIDAGMPKDGPAILSRVSALGFEPKDIKYILVSHAHLDHLGDAKFIAEKTGAKVAVHSADVAAAENPDQTRFGLADFEPFKVDLRLEEGSVITVGDQQVHVHHTPGHTPGCLTFSFVVREEGKNYRAGLFGGPGLNVFSPRGIQLRAYGGTLEDFLKSLDRVASMPIEVFLAPHPNLNDMVRKRDRLFRGEKLNPFIDPTGWRAHIADRQQSAARLRP